MKKYKFIHNETGKEIDLGCEKVTVDIFNEDQVYICYMKIGEEEKTVGVFSMKHFSMYVSK